MKTLTKTLAAVLTAAVIITACKKETAQTTSPAQISNETVVKIQNLGFGAGSIQKHEDGYLVEGDIVITEELLSSVPSHQLLRTPSSEQYHTTNLVQALPRVITVSIASQLPSNYVAALDTAINRFNALNLTITFKRVSSAAKISFVKGNGSYLAAAGFPTSAGEPYNRVEVNPRNIGSQPVQTIASILAHEIGHCIGFRHTDYMSREYSCGGSPTNEGASTVGAINIPGTPTAPDPNSWMLACIGSGMNRPFNANDKIALDYLY